MSETFHRGNRWRFDKTIPISVLIGMTVQCFIFVAWEARRDEQVDGRLTNLELNKVSTIEFVKLQDQMLAIQTAANNSSLTLQTTIQEVKENVKEINANVNRLTIRGKP